MLMAGVHALASLSPALHNPEASLLPDLADVRKVSVEVAAAVVRQAVEDGNATDQETIDVVQGKASQGLEDYIRVRSCFEDSEDAEDILTSAEPYVGRSLQATPVGRLDIDTWFCFRLYSSGMNLLSIHSRSERCDSLQEHRFTL
jgi:hypothetical protein